MKAAILVGGQGRRMGGLSKPLIEIDGRRILDRQLEVLAAANFEVALVGNQLDPFTSYGLRGLADAPGVEGPLAGLIAALEWARPSDVFIVAGDMPDLSIEVLDVFIAAAAENPDVAVIAARSGGRVQPLHAIYRTAYVDTWKRLAVPGKHCSPSRILEGDSLEVCWVDDRVRQIDASGSVFRNVNQPADLS
ncbi:MAG: molybdenum cofactor guanylyltransferase [Deltaproteobacteria bacterium]|nr:molybdenum cofactor guanylyltransferase [Deltaproteobacteria bacterium]